MTSITQIGILLSSLVKSVEGSSKRDYTYIVYVGYDQGDALFDVRGQEVWNLVKNTTRGMLAMHSDW